jgi:hypothetical protein
MERHDPPVKRPGSLLSARFAPRADSACADGAFRTCRGSRYAINLLIAVGFALFVAATVACNESAGSTPAGNTQAGSGATTEASPARSLPIPANYAETCHLVASWCTAASGSLPAALRRPLQVPNVAGSRCPATHGRTFNNGQFGGTALGQGPVRPLVSPERADPRTGVVVFRRWPGDRRWWYAKTLWFSVPAYRGPVFIRGRALDGGGPVVFGEGPTLRDPQLPPGPTVNGSRGWRQWPGGTFLRQLGCYAWQVDGIGFSRVIVFAATR